MHDCMQYGPIQGQGHEVKLEIRPFSKAISFAV